MKKFYPQLRSIQIKTGIWTIVIGLILLLSYLWFTNKLAMSNSYELQIAFSDVMGLEIGDKVMFRGMEVGRVKSIKADQEKIIVTTKIAAEIRLKDGCRFSIADSSLMGGKVLQISQGEGTSPVNIALVQDGTVPEGIMNVIGKASATLTELQNAISALRAPDGLLSSSRSLINNADKAVQNADLMVTDLKKEVSTAVLRMDALAASLQEVVQENREGIKRSVADSPALIAKINGTLDSLQVLSASLNKTALSLNSGEGTAGKLLNDKQLYDKLTTTVESLETLIRDIKANPKKYIKFSVF